MLNQSCEKDNIRDLRERGSKSAFVGTGSILERMGSLWGLKSILGPTDQHKSPPCPLTTFWEEISYNIIANSFVDVIVSHALWPYPSVERG